MINFSDRLLDACKASSDVPDYGKGQQTELAHRLNVSQEAVRKWFAGESVPRLALSKRLATLLDVKHSWLMLGTAHGEIDTDVKLARRHTAGVYGVMAYFIGLGKGAAFSDSGAVDDLTIIERGRILKICVEVAEKTEDGGYQVRFSDAQRKAGTTVVMVSDHHKHRSAAMDLLEITDGIWSACGRKQRGGAVLQFRKTPRGFSYYAGNEKLNKFLET